MCASSLGAGKDRCGGLSQTTHHLASTAISTSAHEQVSLAFTRHLEVEGQLVGTALGAAIDGLGLTEPWRRYALELAHWTLLGEGDPAGATSRGRRRNPWSRSTTFGRVVPHRPSRSDPSSATSRPWTTTR